LLVTDWHGAVPSQIGSLWRARLPRATLSDLRKPGQNLLISPIAPTSESSALHNLTFLGLDNYTARRHQLIDFALTSLHFRPFTRLTIGNAGCLPSSRSFIVVRLHNEVEIVRSRRFKEARPGRRKAISTTQDGFPTQERADTFWLQLQQAALIVSEHQALA
jgi:hypothetical protein